MQATIESFALEGIDAVPVEVQVAVDPGYPQVTIVGLPDTSVRESRERIFAAFRHAGLKLPPQRVTVNLAPAEIRKEGSAFDLPIALAILAAAGGLEAGLLRDVSVVGELSLSGEVRAVRGVVSMAVGGARLGGRKPILPAANLTEAGGIPGVRPVAVRTLREACAVLGMEGVEPEPDVTGCGTSSVDRAVRGDPSEGRAVPAGLSGRRSGSGRPVDPGGSSESGGSGDPGRWGEPGRPVRTRAPVGSAGPEAPDGRAGPYSSARDLLGQIHGQAFAKRAIEIAAAGAHNLLLFGPPGAGKTLLARALVGILPPLVPEEALEVTMVQSVAGLLPPGTTRVWERPFRAPHHTASPAGLVGGGANPRPGEVSLAHCGVLFLDEMPEFRLNVLNLLRQPLEDGWVRLVRAGRTVCYPSKFMLVAAMNPCPCGFLGHRRRPCTCTPRQIESYQGRISGPLMDRIDLHVEVPALPASEMVDPNAPEPETAEDVRRRVCAARDRQRLRFARGPVLSGDGSAGAHRSASPVDPDASSVSAGGGPVADAGPAAAGHDPAADEDPAAASGHDLIADERTAAASGHDPVVDERTPAADGPSGRPTARRVRAARRGAGALVGEDDPLCNAQMGLEEIRRYCEIDRGTQAILEKAVEALSLSARGVHRTLRVARTIADLEGAVSITRDHVAEAVQYRMFERK